MISLVLLMAGISIPSAHAFLGSGDTKVKQSYGCLSLDGIPIPQSGDLFKTCCSGGHLVANPPSSCRVFSTIGDDASDDATGGFQVAENALNTARNLDGVDSNFGASDDGGGSTNGGSGGNTPDTAAIQSGTGGLDPTTGSGTDLGALDFGSGSNDGSSGGASAGGAGAAGGGDGLSVGSISGSGTDSALKNGASTSGAANANGDDSRLAYIGGGADGANGKGGFGSGSGSAGMDKSLKELELGDQNGRDPNAANAGDEAQGTSEDPADYFSRIDRSADLFKIVSSRYQKKKSLFLIKQ